MKILFFIFCTMFAFTFIVQNSALAQNASRKKQTIVSKASSTQSDELAKLKRSENIKDHPKPKSRGDVYGPNYSDIIVDNYTGYNIDIYVDGNFRGTLGPWDKKVTWAIPGNTRLYAKATFDDGTYITWGPTLARTGYEYTWSLTH